MRRRRVDSKLERQFLIGLITSKPFLASASPAIDLSLLQTDCFRQVAEWCLDYFQEYGDAPGQNIEALYHAWVESNDADESEDIGDFLGTLSSEYETADGINVAHLLDELGTYLSTRKLTMLSDSITADLMAGEVGDALNAVSDFTSVDLGKGIGIDVLNDRSAWTRAFATPPEPLIIFPGDAGQFFGPALTRDALIGVQGPEKMGKTFWCIEFAIRSLRNRKKVAVFEVGDLSESQIMMRLGSRLSKRPIWLDHCGDIEVPASIKLIKELDDEGHLQIRTAMKHRVVIAARPATKRVCVRACRKFVRALGLPKQEPHFMLSVHPNSSINVKGITGILQRWRHEKNFVPDVIIIDYADILAPENVAKESRDQVNETWKALRRLSQEQHCLVIAPTQADAATYKTQLQTMGNFSEDKRKMAHVTGMLGLNRTDQEKEDGLMRLNWLVLREHDFSPRRCLYVGQCLPLARAFCCGAL